MRAILPAVALLSLLATAPARADQAAVVRTMTEAGLINHRWAWDCDKPVGLNNRELSFGVAGNGVLASYDSNGSYVDLYWIEAVYIAANGDIVVTRAMHQDHNAKAYEVVYRRTGTDLRLWLRVSLDGQTVIARDGLYAGGTPTETWKRCD